MRIMSLPVKLPWTISFLIEWLPRMTLASALRLRDHSTREQSDGMLTFKMRRPFRGPIYLRAKGSDILTFHEVVSDEIYKTVLSHLKECRTIIDLGANIGLASRYFAAHYPNCQIVAVEPNPDTFRVLTENLKDFPNAKLVEAAVWASETSLSGTSDPNHFSAFAVLEDNHGRMRGIPISKIIAMCEQARVDLLKVDIEGAETQLFKGDLNWLRQVKCIAIEFHNDSRESSRFDEIMLEYGFEVFEGKHTVIAVQRKAA
jgi:FkbM family methyltransferase